MRSRFAARALRRSVVGRTAVEVMVVAAGTRAGTVRVAAEAAISRGEDTDEVRPDSAGDVAIRWNGAATRSIYTADAGHPRIAVRIPAAAIEWGVNDLRLTAPTPFVLHDLIFYLAKADTQP